MSAGVPEAPDGAGRRFVRHAFVCTSSTSCAKDGPAEEIRAWMKRQKREAGLKEQVRVNKAGCLGQCGHGPMIVVYPEGVWYSHVGLDDARRIWEEHMVGGRPVEDLRYRTPAGGTNVVPRLPGPDGPGTGAPDTASPWWVPCTRCPGTDVVPHAGR